MRVKVRGITLLLLVTLLAPILSTEATAKTTSCTQKQKLAVKSHITKQIKALAKSDWNGAYGYAAKSFQNSIPIEVFTEIIESQYEFLIINDGFTFGACKNSKSAYSQVVIVDFEGNKRTLSYDLTLIGKRLGIVSATEIRQSPGVAA